MILSQSNEHLLFSVERERERFLMTIKAWIGLAFQPIFPFCGFCGPFPWDQTETLDEAAMLAGSKVSGGL